jgi:hypothetical protein
MLRTTGLCIATIFLCLSSASAQDPEWWDRIGEPGAYVSVAAAGGGLVSIDDEAPTGEKFDSADAGGIHARAGYRFFRWIGADLHFEWLHHRFTKSQGNQNRRAHGDTYAITADGKLFLPRWANAEFFLLTGVGVLIDDDNISNNDAEFAARFGGGVDVHVTERFGVTIGGSYVMPTEDLDNLDYASGEAGFFYRF